MELAVISDSHIPSRAAAIPEPFRDRIRAADHVVHAGDVTSAAALSTVADLASGLTAVSGNMDPGGLELPPVATLEVGGVTFVATHGTGPDAGYGSRVAGVVRETAGGDAVGIAGHTHEVLDATVDGVRLLNPGSVTGAAPARRTTMMTLEVDAGSVDPTVHVLD